MSKHEDAEQKLITDISKIQRQGGVATANLSTDQRVLARITDGIYRQPASALRELIANAYDADAENVYIFTDCPRFSKIVIRDDGQGLSIASLARLIYHIGGSSKRTADGIRLGIVDAGDPTLSPKGRRLIGKIGIGLFSVAQLTRHFKIITKVRGESFRLVAEVILKTYTEELLAEAGDRSSIQAGEVRIVSVPAEDKDSHGTEITLLNLRPQTRDLLRSKELWEQAGTQSDAEQAIELRAAFPKYHIGRIKPGSDDELETVESLPWTKKEPVSTRFAKLYRAVQDAVGDVESNPRLETLLDNYLRMLWTLSLSAPLDYLEDERHPFDLTNRDSPRMFELSLSQGQANPIVLNDGQTLREKLDLQAPERGVKTPFNVFIDDIQLMRPLRFRELLRSSGAVATPILFVGKASPDLSKISWDERGGDLSFEAYFLWTPKVVPKEHTGVLIRIGDASGTLFDESFMKYQVSEMQRLRQITAEVFVHKGLDAALNIDRESFNYAHPHYQYLMKWVHRALRQVATTHKHLAAENRNENHRQETETRNKALQEKVARELGETGKYKDSKPPEVRFVGKGEQQDLFKEERKKGTLTFDAEVVFGIAEVNEAPPSKGRGSRRKKAASHYREEQVKAVAQILDAYGCFEGMSYAKQQRLLRAVAAVFDDSKHSSTSTKR